MQTVRLNFSGEKHVRMMGGVYLYPTYSPATSADECTLRSFGAFDDSADDCRTMMDWRKFSRSVGIRLVFLRDGVSFYA